MLIKWYKTQYLNQTKLFYFQETWLRVWKIWQAPTIKNPKNLTHRFVDFGK